MNNETSFENGELQIKPRKRIQNFFVLVISFACAMLVWLYVLGYDSPNYEKEFTVNVQVMGEDTLREEMGYTVLSDFGCSVKVTLSGPQSDVNKLGDESINAYIDVSEVKTPGNNYLKIHVSIPEENNITVSSQSSDTALIYVDECVTAEIPVKLDITDYTLPESYTVGDYSVNPASVTVEGPKTEIEKIVCAYASVSPGKLVSSTKINTSVVLQNQSQSTVNSSYIHLLDSSVNVEIPVYKTKDVPVNVYFVGGYYGKDSAVITLSDEYVTVRGFTEDVDKIDEIKINIAENTLTSDTVIKRLSLPEGVESVDGIESVTVKIKFNSVVSRVLSVNCSSSCKVINAPEGYEVTVTTATVNVTVKGPMFLLGTISPQNLEGTVNLENMSLEKGKTYSVPIDLGVAEEYLSEYFGVFVSGEYSVTVSVN